MRSYLLVIVFALSAIGLFGQNADLSNPRNSVYNHLWYLQKEQFKPSIAAKSFENVQSEGEKLERLAIQLKQIYDGKGIFIDTSLISEDPNYLDSASGKHRFEISNKLPSIYLVRRKGNWVYSESSTELIQELHAEVYPMGLARLMNAIPDSFHSEFLGLEVGQYVGILFIIFFSLIIQRLFTFVFRRVIYTFLKKVSPAYVASKLLTKVAGPLSWFFVLMVAVQLVPGLLLPIGISRYVILILNLLKPLIGTLIFYHLVSLLAQFFENQAKKTSGTLDDQLVPLISKLMKGIVVVFGVAYMLFALDVDIRPYLLGVSFGGLALALAAQDTVKNLFGSAMIFLDRPFQIGDWVNFEGMDGTVESVGFRSTRLRTFHDSLISVPNGKFADGVVDNYGLRVYRRYSTKLTITYDTPPELVEGFIEGLRELVRNHPNTRKDYFEIHLNDLGATSLEIIFYIFFDTKNWSGELVARHEILMAVLRLAKALGIRFAFPTQTIHIEEVPGLSSLGPANDLGKADIDTSMMDFIEKWKKSLEAKGQGQN